MKEKEKVHLEAEQETLLITLYSKAYGCAGSLFDDQKIKEILDGVDYDFKKLKVPSKTILTICLRAKKFDGYVREFLIRHPGGMVLHLACGLDTRYDRVDNGEVEWYDLDLPDVIDLRKRFFKETNRYHMIASSVTDLRWLEEVAYQGQPVMVVAEGLMMYLEERDVKSLVLKLKEKFPGCELVFDAFSTLTAKNIKRHPSIMQTGAAIKWGIDDPKAVEGWASGIRLREEWSYTQSDEISKFGLANLLIYRLAGLFSVVRRAHRILYYKLCPGS